jgi:hypothetical protein
MMKMSDERERAVDRDAGQRAPAARWWEVEPPPLESCVFVDLSGGTAPPCPVSRTQTASTQTCK